MFERRLHHLESSIKEPTPTECEHNIIDTYSVQLDAIQNNHTSKKTAFVKHLMFNWII